MNVLHAFLDFGGVAFWGLMAFCAISAFRDWLSAFRYRRHAR